MDLLKTGQYVISLLNVALGTAECEDIPSGVSWQDVVEFAEIHKVSNILGYVIGNIGNVPLDAVKFFAERMKAAIVIDAQQDYLLESISTEFDKAKIKNIPLKGYILKKMYPRRDMRTMSDIDFYVEYSSIEETRKLMNSNGFKMMLSTVEEDNYGIDANMYVEIHRTLIGEEFPIFHKYYQNMWDRVVNDENYRYKMTDEDFYIYHIVHLAKHYQYSGIGLRFFLDVHVYLEKMKNKMNWDYINNEFDLLKLREFHQYIIELSDMWFKNAARNDILSDMEKYIFESGVHGNKKNMQIIRETKKTGRKKIKYYLRKLFPTIKIMSGSYPYIYKKKYLLPVLWIHRLITKLASRHYKETSLIDRKVTNEEKADVEMHLKKVGLK